MVAQAQAATAPRMTREAAAAALGADLARLERALAGARGKRRGRGHRFRAARGPGRGRAVGADRRAARVGHQRARPGRARPGSWPRSRRAWREAGLGPVIGITASQSARNTLAAGGIESYNSARFLGHLPGQRGAQGPLCPSQRAPSWRSTRRR